MNMIESLFLLGFTAGYLLIGMLLLARGFIGLLLDARRSLPARNSPLIAPRKWKQSWMNPKLPGGSPRIQLSDPLMVKPDVA
jgi:hypothetical protein